jgi:predicted hydrolase (HD superfamily)
VARQPGSCTRATIPRMSVPARREAASLLLSLEPPEWFLRHACAVADVAGWLAAAINARGGHVDAAAVEAAALLHDVDKLPSVGRAEGVRHGDGSAAFLEARGLPELAVIVRDHPVTRLAGDQDRARLLAAPLEARIVAYADKRAGQHLQTMDQRFGAWRRDYPVVVPAGTDRAGRRPPKRAAWTDEEVERIQERARELELEICGAAGIEPLEVDRLRWSRRSLRAVER